MKLSETQTSVLGLLDEGGVFWYGPSTCYLTQKDKTGAISVAASDVFALAGFNLVGWRGESGYWKYTISEAGRAAYREWREAQNG